MRSFAETVWHVGRRLGLTRILSDGLFMRLQYRAMMGKWLRLNPPRDFNEKVQWLKLHYRNPLYVIGADKYEVRKLVAERIGEEYLAKCLGVYERVEDIDFDALPDKFVLKATHGSGWNIICPDKSKLNLNLARTKIRKWLTMDFTVNGREWQYHEIKPRIICEEFLVDPECPTLRDYKLFTFNGETKYLWVDFVERAAESNCPLENREVGYAKPKVANGFVSYRNIYDANWVFQPDKGSDHPCKDTSEIKKPECLGEMLRVAHDLAYDFPQCRVDLYVLGGKRIVFGELTFSSACGCNRFYPQSFCDELGSYITLPEKECV